MNNPPSYEKTLLEDEQQKFNTNQILKDEQQINKIPEYSEILELYKKQKSGSFASRLYKDHKLTVKEYTNLSIKYKKEQEYIYRYNNSIEYFKKRIENKDKCMIHFSNKGMYDYIIMEYIYKDRVKMDNNRFKYEPYCSYLKIFNKIKIDMNKIYKKDENMKGITLEVLEKESGILVEKFNIDSSVTGVISIMMKL